ncbi:MAG: 4Fe-4S binding protein [Bacteroidales bacterium]|nr:4Fe-4S binding protein [Bacteroidales bacterium]
MTREIVIIDEEKCNGCGLCVPECHEGALQIIDGIARLISDLFCDGLGACLGHCPEGALSIEKREAEPYDERKVIGMMVKKGENTVQAHLKHLDDHGETDFLNTAINYLKEIDFDTNLEEFTKNKTDMVQHEQFAGCPGSRAVEFNIDQDEVDTVTQDSSPEDSPIQSELRQWPVQLHLLNPNAGYFKNADVLLAAECAAYTIGDFHRTYLKGKTLAIACPKLDSNLESYIAKFTSMIDEAEVNTITVLRMQVPCCGGLLQIVEMAKQNAKRNIPVKEIMVGVQGEVLKEEWI